jgi:hypothetical protein
MQNQTAPALMSLEQFRATRIECENLIDHIDDGCLEDEAGFLYLDTLYIRKDADGSLWLLLGRDETTGTLEELEAMLYEWALCEGYAEPTEDQRAILDEIGATEARFLEVSGDEFAKLHGILADLRAQLIAVNP